MSSLCTYGALLGTGHDSGYVGSRGRSLSSTQPTKRPCMTLPSASSMAVTRRPFARMS